MLAVNVIDWFVCLTIALSISVVRFLRIVGSPDILDISKNFENEISHLEETRKFQLSMNVKLLTFISSLLFCCLTLVKLNNSATLWFVVFFRVIWIDLEVWRQVSLKVASSTTTTILLLFLDLKVWIVKLHHGFAASLIEGFSVDCLTKRSCETILVYNLLSLVTWSLTLYYYTMLLLISKLCICNSLRRTFNLNWNWTRSCVEFLPS